MFVEVTALQDQIQHRVNLVIVQQKPTKTAWIPFSHNLQQTPIVFANQVQQNKNCSNCPARQSKWRANTNRNLKGSIIGQSSLFRVWSRGCQNEPCGQRKTLLKTSAVDMGGVVSYFRYMFQSGSQSCHQVFLSQNFEDGRPVVSCR